MNTVEKYRPTMRNEVLHSWAEDAQAELDALRAKCRRYEDAMQAHHSVSCATWWDDPCNCWVGSTIGLIP